MGEFYVLDAVRTPIGRHSGALAGVRPDDLAAHALESLVERSPDLDPAQIEDVVLGDANQAGEDDRCVARLAVSSRAPEQPSGCPIAIAPPFGLTISGSRSVHSRRHAIDCAANASSLAHELRRRGGGWGLATMCIGVGQGIAMVLEA